jgi:hypothetical protein
MIPAEKIVVMYWERWPVDGNLNVLSIDGEV